MTELTEIEFNRSDRDLLVELRTEMRAVRSDIAELKDDSKQRLADLERDVGGLKVWRGLLIGISLVITVLLIPLLVSYVGSGEVHITGN